MVPQEFQPTLNEQTVRNYISLYNQRPEKLSEDDLKVIEHHADYYRIPFSITEFAQQGRVAGLLKQAGAGFASGFSTFNVGEEPRDEWESIARNVGHLAGFVGYVPSLPFKLLHANKLVHAANKLRGKSIPMVAAKWAEEKVSKIAANTLSKGITARAGATGAAVGFLQKPVVQDLLKGSFHLGVASSVGAWQGGVDEMMRAFIGGAETGAVFRGIGNIVRTGSQSGDKVLRGLASSLYTGLHSTARGDTTPEQVYEYLLGAYFGVKEMPYHRRLGMKHLSKMEKEKAKGGLNYKDPETIKGWDELDAKTQKFVKEEGKKVFKTEEETMALAYQIAEDFKIPIKEAIKRAEEQEKELPKYTSEGEEISPLVKKVPQSENEVKLSLSEEKDRESTVNYEKDNTDAGTSVGDMIFTVKTEKFARETLENSWKEQEDPLSSLQRVSYDVEQKWSDFTKKARDGDGLNPSDKMVDWIQKKFKVSLDENGRNFWRQWGESKVKGERVPMLTTTNGVIVEISSGKDMNAVGNRKILIEEPKPIDDVFNTANNSKGERAYGVLDHAVVTVKGKGLQEVEMQELERIYFQEEYDEARKHMSSYDAYDLAENIAKNRVQEFHGKNAMAMDKKGYYYYGGKGDANRQYFVRYHPKTGKTESVPLVKQIIEIKKAFLKNKISGEQFKKAFEKSRDDWIAERPMEGVTLKEQREMFKRAYVSNVLYELEMNGLSSDISKSLPKALSGGFINSAREFNKRQQIWFTSGFSSSPDFIEGKVKDVKDGKFNAVLIKEEDNKHKLWTDGSVYGRDDVIDAQNADWGLPSIGGNSKSFIVSKSDKGGILGKYMVHPVSKPIADLMKKEHIHFIIPESSSKQFGMHEQGTLKWVNGKPVIKGGEVNIPIKDLKGVLSEKTDEHFLDRMRVPKQMLSNLTPYGYSDIKPEVIEDMYETLSRRSFLGEEEWNSKLDTYLSDPKSYKHILPELIENLDKISIPKVLDGIQQENAVSFANAAYGRIQRVNKSILDDMIAEGEMTDAELKDSSLEANEQIKVHERLMKHSSDSLSGLLHKFTNDYRMTTMRNYVVNRLARPRVGNSFAMRFRPYDIGLRNKFIKNLSEDEFYLDDGFKSLKISSEHWDRPRTLEDVWKEFQKPKGFSGIRPEIEELLRAVIARVPMDSPSGAHVLHFKGFTGVRGFGGLAHEKTMEALGGADLDGDKAFGFFGGEEGHGFKKTWKDMYHAQKDEYKSESTEDLKEAFRPMFTSTPTKKLTKRQEHLAENKDKVLQYSPYERGRFSDLHADGRTRLGPAVVNKSVVNATYAAIRASDAGHYDYRVNLAEPGEPDSFVTIRMIPRTSKKDLTELGRRGRASVAFSSDPMDETGLKDRNVFYNELVDAAFKWEVYEDTMKGVRREGSKKIELVPTGKQKLLREETYEANYEKPLKWVRYKRQGLTGVFSGVNSALYGRNLTEGRRYTFNEIKDRLERAFDPYSGLEDKSRNTLLPKLAADLRNMDWNDSIFRRVDKDRLISLYNEHNKNFRTFDWIKKIMGRETMGVPRGAYIDLVFKHELWKEGVVGKEGSSSKSENLKGLKSLLRLDIKDPLRGKAFKTYNQLGPKDKEIYDPKNMEQRERFLRDILKKAEDYIVSDLSDIASLTRIVKIAKEVDNPAIIEDLFNIAENLKRTSYLQYRARKGKIDMSDKARRVVDETIGEDLPLSALVDQNSINKAINSVKYKTDEAGNLLRGEDGKYIRRIPKREADLFDNFLIGTWNRGKHEAIRKLESARAKAMELGDRDVILGINKTLEKLVDHSDNTSLSRLGFASKAVGEDNIREFMREYGKLFDYATTIPSKKEQKRVKEEAQMADEKIALIDESGNRIKGSFFEASDYDESTRKYLDEYAPFVGLKKGKLKGEIGSLYSELKEHLDYYHNDIGKNLNGLIRAVLGKDINQMDFQDFRVLNEWFKDKRTGTWYNKFFDKVKDGSPRISKWLYNKFPEAINRDLLRYEMKLIDEIRPYQDRFGNIISGKAMKPVSVMEELQTWIHRSQEMSIQSFEEEKKILQEKLSPYLKGVEDGDALHEMAARLRERGIIKEVLKPQYGNQNVFGHYAEIYEGAYRQSAKDTDWKTIRHKVYPVAIGGKVKRMTGEEIVQEIRNKYTDQNEIVHQWLVGKEGAADKYLKLDDGSMKGLVKLRKKFLEDLKESARKGERFLIDIGIDGMRRIAKRVMMSQMPKMYRDEIDVMRKNMVLEEESGPMTGKYKAEVYWPHMLFDRKVAGKALDRALDVVMNDSSMSKEDKVREVKKLSYHHKQLTGDWIPTDSFGDNWDVLNKALEEVAEGKRRNEDVISWFHSNQKVGSQFSRTAHIGGWSVEPAAYENYMKNILDTYYRLASQIAARTTIIDFRHDHLKKYGNPDMTNAWGNFFNLYAQQSMGYPSKIPQKVLDHPETNVKGTPFAWFADSQVLGKLNKMRKKLGVKEDERLPEEMHGFDYNQLTSWGNLEAKYELASLLAHPKSAVANLYGGTVHTLVSTGYSNFKNARSLGYLKTHINDKWESMADVEEWVRGHGVIEEFLLYEADINPKLKGKKWKRFIKDASARISREPEMEDTSLRELAKKHGITGSIFDKAAWFMRRPERTLRRDAFVAHYLQAREKFGGAIKDYDHPYLINLAKKGVKGTQFLYSAPFRPLFAGTTLGKVWTRFQLWSWNSVRFRNEVIRNAHIHGWREGTPEFERFKRLATADLMMLSLSSVFMYSLFENALPAPWNWFQDLSDLMLGDDKERERAFFGAYPYPLQPLQMVTPPLLRTLPPLFKGLVQDDYSKLSNYYIWTMFPFGRFARDIAHPKSGLLVNPTRGIEKLTGLPYMQFAKEKKEEKDKTKLKPRGLL